MKKLLSILFLTSVAGSSFAATNTYSTTFTATQGTIGGYGYFSFTGTPTVSDYLGELPSPSLNINLSGHLFTLNDILWSSSVASLSVDFSDGRFQFTNTQTDTYTHGSVSFENAAGDFLSLAPVRPGESFYSQVINGYTYHSAYMFNLASEGGRTKRGAPSAFGAYGLGSPAAAGASPAVPEPSTYGLIGIGALAIAVAARRRKLKTA
jgi:hypothetical protein